MRTSRRTTNRIEFCLLCVSCLCEGLTAVAKMYIHPTPRPCCDDNLNTTERHRLTVVVQSIDIHIYACKRSRGILDFSGKTFPSPPGPPRVPSPRSLPASPPLPKGFQSTPEYSIFRSRLPSDYRSRFYPPPRPAPSFPAPQRLICTRPPPYSCLTVSPPRYRRRNRVG